MLRPSEPVVAVSFDLVSDLAAEQLTMNPALVVAVLLAFGAVNHDLVAVDQM